MGISLDTPVAALLTNKRRVGALKSFGIATIGDALTYYPFRVADPVPARALGEARPAEPMAFVGVIRASRVVTGRTTRLEAVVEDADFAAARRIPARQARLTFFSHNRGYVDWMSHRLAAGRTIVIAGTPGEYQGQLQFTHPQTLTVGEGCDAPDPTTALRRVCRPRPVYHASARLSSERIHETILHLLHLLGGRDLTPDTAAIEHGTAQPDPEEAARYTATLAAAIPDILPETIRQERGLLHRHEAFQAIHEPPSTDRFNQGIATLRYEEAFICQTALLHTRRTTHRLHAHPCPEHAGNDLRERFISTLPFTLTAGQREVIDAIGHDMSLERPMQRLLQGEVGSGKTVVALAAMLQAVGAGHQAVLVAPTQVLAEQHHATIARMTAALEDAQSDAPAIPVTLLTGGMRLAARRKALAQAASGQPGIIVATHAAFSKRFQAPNLALAVIDEQHRFGVEQRESLQARAGDDAAPHLLVMTATPIPRTAAMTWFGDLDLSWLTELPGGRRPIRTVVVEESDSATMGRMFAHLRRRVDAGERAYVVCARIDADDARDADDEDDIGKGRGDKAEKGVEGIADEYGTLDENGEQTAAPPLHAVEEIEPRLSALPQFQGVRLATLTGRDKDETKAEVMASFASGETPVLVSTTVIEVGVDVKEASCIVIFDADRYGLSQLHQLRGRVGRGGTDSWAFLVSRAAPGTPGQARLDVIRDSLDGAEIAQADLEFRGAGDVLGDAQSGARSSLRLLRVVKDADIIADARTRAETLLAADPELAGEPQLAGAVLDFTRGNETFLTSN